MKPTFATFWHGSGFTPYELACLHSFVAHGYEVSVYSYGPVEGFPDWLVARDASEILPSTTLTGFVVDGKPSFAHFSDYFRLVLFAKTDHVWIDADVVLLKPFDMNFTGNVMAQDTPTGVCNAVLHLDRNDPRLAAITARVAALVGKPQRYSATGPVLLTEIYGLKDALPGSTFYPTGYPTYYKVFLPELRDECTALCQDSYTLHLWNYFVVKTGILKWEGPPEGSFLYEALEATGGNKFFRGHYPEAVMKVLVHNTVVKIGDDAGISRVLRLLVPVAKKTLRKRYMVLAKRIGARFHRKSGV